jgi:hypothetical protein
MPMTLTGIGRSFAEAFSMVDMVVGDVNASWARRDRSHHSSRRPYRRQNRNRLEHIGLTGGGGALLGYARVSKGGEQNNVLQTKALKAASCWRVFERDAENA